MALTKFKLRDTDGLKGLTHKGDFIPFQKLDDVLAEQLIGKTHVLERIAESPAPGLAPPLAEPQDAPAKRK